MVTGRDIVSIEDTMGAVPHEGDLVTFADDTADRAMDLDHAVVSGAAGGQTEPS